MSHRPCQATATLTPPRNRRYRLSSSGDDSLTARQRDRARVLAAQASDWLADRRAISVPIDVSARIYERDRAYFGSVLGSAVAFRLFLFILSATALGVGIGTSLIDVELLDDQVGERAGLTGAVAVEVDQAFEGTQTTAWLLTVSGLVGTLWTGRNLATTLSAASANAWQLGHSVRTATARIVFAVVGLFAALLIVSAVVGLIHRSAGPAAATTSLVLAFIVYAVIWFVVTMTLPRGTSDPGAMLPGAALTGLVMMGMAGISQLYIGRQLETKSEVLGGLAIAAVGLGWLFFAGRAMVASLAVNAVIFEQIGSVSHLLVILPGIRRIPRRFPSVARYFDLEEMLDAEAPATGAPTETERPPGRGVDTDDG